MTSSTVALSYSSKYAFLPSASAFRITGAELMSFPSPRPDTPVLIMTIPLVIFTPPSGGDVRVAILM
jgi:hypothetical protein